MRLFLFALFSRILNMYRNILRKGENTWDNILRATRSLGVKRQGIRFSSRGTNPTPVLVTVLVTQGESLQNIHISTIFSVII